MDGNFVISENQRLTLTDIDAIIGKKLEEKLNGFNDRLTPNLGNCTENDTDVPESENGMERIRDRVQVGNNADGTPCYKWVTGRTKQEFFQNVARALGEAGKIEAAPPPRADNPMFNDYLTNWFKTIRQPMVPKRTAEGNGILKNYLLPFFKGKRLAEIRYMDIAAYFAQPAIQRLARSTADNHGEMLNMVFKMAVRNELIDKNPVTDYKQYLPKKKTPRHALKSEDIADIISNLHKLRAEDRLFMSILIYTGCRRGEALGLQVKDIDPTRQSVEIRQGVVFEHNHAVIDTPKTEGSVRTIPIVPGFPYELICNMEPDSFILGGSAPWTETKYRRAWGRIKKTIDLHGATPHVLRHTFATLAIRAGIDLKTVQGVLGHATAATTMNIYADVQKEKLAKEAARFSELYKQPCDSFVTARTT